MSTPHLEIRIKLPGNINLNELEEFLAKINNVFIALRNDETGFCPLETNSPDETPRFVMLAIPESWVNELYLSLLTVTSILVFEERETFIGLLGAIDMHLSKWSVNVSTLKFIVNELTLKDNV